MQDRYHQGTVERVSPEAPIPVVKITKEEIKLPGGAHNVVSNLHALGVKVLTKSSSVWPIKHRLMVGDIQVARWDEFDECPPIVPEHIPKEVNRIVVADYGKGSITPEVQLALYEMNLPTFVDTKKDPTPYIGWVTAIFPNQFEYERYKTAYNKFERCIVTRGMDGADVLSFGSVIEHVEAFSKKPICVSGAGDTFTAAYALRWPRTDASIFASLAAAVVVEKPMTGTASQAEIKEYRRKLKRDNQKQ